MRPGSPNQYPLRIVGFVTAAVFVFFLIDLMPHRVHHMFDPGAENACVAFTLSKGCTTSTSVPAFIIFAPTTSRVLGLSPKTWISYLSPSPFDGRAPPLA